MRAAPLQEAEDDQGDPLEHREPRPVADADFTLPLRSLKSELTKPMGFASQSVSAAGLLLSGDLRFP